MESFNIEIGWEQLCLRCMNKGKRAKMRLDLVFCHYVCIKCGWAVKSGCKTIQDKFGSEGGRWCRSYTYSRRNQFSDRLDKKGCVPPNVSHMLACKFIKINRFYNVKIVGSDVHKVYRKNILKYEYLIQKMLQLLKRHDWASKFSPPKTKRKIEEYERIWKIICKHFGWVFYDNIVRCKLINEIHALRMTSETKRVEDDEGGVIYEDVVTTKLKSCSNS